MDAPKVPTAEEVKAMLRAYLDAHHPQGRSASAMFDTGTPGQQPEVLVITTPREAA